MNRSPKHPDETKYPNPLPRLFGKQNWANLLPQAFQLTNIVFQKVMRPSVVGVVTTVFGQCRPDCFVGPQRSPQFFWLAPSPQHKNPFIQVSRNLGHDFFETIFSAIEIKQQDHEPVCVSLHFGNVNYFETIHNLKPTACFLKYLHSARVQRRIKLETVGQLAVCIVLW